MRFRANVDVDALVAAIAACYDSSGAYAYDVPEHRDERKFHLKVCCSLVRFRLCNGALMCF